jgi:hypothetical protein
MSKGTVVWIDTEPTFWNIEETKEHNAIAVCSSDAIVYVSDGEIDRPEFVMSCSDRYGCFVATKNDGAKDRAMCFRILGDNVLNKRLNKRKRGDSENLPPVSKPKSRT